MTKVKTKTENGMSAYESTLNANLDLFFKGGAMRTADEKDITELVSKAFAEDPATAIKVIGLIRDCRGGFGEKRFTKIASKYMLDNGVDPKKIIYIAKELGYWKDAFILFDTPGETALLDSIQNGLLVEQDGLLAKYLDRQGAQATKVRKHMGIKTPKEYRKILVGLTKVVETQMCAGNFGGINYSQVPSKAMKNYSRAFGKRDTTRFVDFIEEAKKGNVKINSSVLFPHEIVAMVEDDKNTAIAMWNQLPNYLEGNNARFICVVDTSGSMKMGDGVPYNIATALGIYFSERANSIFKNKFITFAGRPKLQSLKGDLAERLDQFVEDNTTNTNLERVFETILDAATSNHLKAEDMPTHILLLSDLAFDSAYNADDTAMEMIRKKYEANGYQTPNIVFWNIKATPGSMPVRFDDNGVALVSGASPAIIQAVLGAKLNPVDIMMEAINKPKYNVLVDDLKVNFQSQPTYTTVDNPFF